MTKKILASVLTLLIILGCVYIPASAEGEAALSFTETVSITVYNTYILTEGSLTSFGVEATLNDANVIALDGFNTESSIKVVSVKSKRNNMLDYIEYDSENPDPFLDIFRFTETDDEGNIKRESVNVDVTVQIDYTHAEVFGDLGYTVTINGFSTPPDLGMIGGLLGDAVAVPDPIETTFKVSSFPSIANMSIVNASTKMFYKDSEKPELEGVKLNVTTSTGKTGTVTYAPANAHMFTTVPAKNEKLTVDDKEIVTYFSGIRLTTLPITVEHDWSKYPVNITTDKYTDTKPGYHAIVCNGCSETHTAEAHVIDPDAWVSNDDSTFTNNGTASQPCQVCGATLTKDVLGSADYNDAFENYHFLRVIFDYINLILRLIGGAGVAK